LSIVLASVAGEPGPYSLAQVLRRARAPVVVHLGGHFHPRRVPPELDRQLDPKPIGDHYDVDRSKVLELD